MVKRLAALGALAFSVGAFILLLVTTSSTPVSAPVPLPAKAEAASTRQEDRMAWARLKARDLVTEGLAALAKTQNPDGSIGDSRTISIRIALTSIALMAFLSDGHFENRGLYAAVVRDATKFLISSAQRDGERCGYFETVGDNESRMHGQGFATLALCQVYGHHGLGRRFAGTSEELKSIIREAVDLIVRSQNSAGGWYYEPFDSVEDEGSITVTMIQALRAARNAGVFVSPRVIERALEYVKSSQNPDGSIRYSLRNHREGSIELTAAGLGVLAYGGEYDSQAVRAARDYLWGRETIFSENVLTYPFYGFFYAIQALWFDYNADRLEAYFPRFVSWYDGHWDKKEKCYLVSTGLRLKENAYGPDYATAMATLSLQVPAWSLPIFDR